MLPIHFAAMFNRLDCVAMLLDRGSYMQQPPAKKVSHERCNHGIMVWPALRSGCASWITCIGHAYTCACCFVLANSRVMTLLLHPACATVLPPSHGRGRSTSCSCRGTNPCSLGSPADGASSNLRLHFYKDVHVHCPPAVLVICCRVGCRCLGPPPP